MRTGVRRQIATAAQRPRRVFKAYLAEAYDGIGKTVKITLSRGSLSAGQVARVASGDFGGSRIFPVGTLVHVVSYRGIMEVHLGNHPGNCDPFSRTTAFDEGGWGAGPIGRWYGPAEYYSQFQPDVYADVWAGEVDAPRAWVQDGKGYFGYVFPFDFATDDPVRLLPIKKLPKKMVIDYISPHVDTEWALIFYWARDFYYVWDEWITMVVSWSRPFNYPTNPEIFEAYWRGGSADGNEPWEIDGSSDASITIPITAANAHVTWRVVIEFRETGWFAKTWRLGVDTEPTEFEIQTLYVDGGNPPDLTYFNYFYIENQSGSVNGFSSGPQEVYEVGIDKVCIYY